VLLNTTGTAPRTGDANRDGSVDFNDLVSLAQNYNSAGGKGWSQGDFTGDGSVDFHDLVELAQNYNTGAPSVSGPTGNFSADFGAALAGAAALPTVVAPTAKATKSNPKAAPTPKPRLNKPISARATQGSKVGVRSTTSPFTSAWPISPRTFLAASSPDRRRAIIRDLAPSA
jgi:hypothetical protein